MHRLISVGKHKLPPIELGKDGTLSLPWSSGEDAALLEFSGDCSNHVIVTCLTEDATLTVTKRGAAAEELELGLSLDMEIGSKLEITPCDPTHGAKGSYVYLVTALKRQMPTQATPADVPNPVAAAPGVDLITPAPTLTLNGPGAVLTTAKRGPADISPDSDTHVDLAESSKRTKVTIQEPEKSSPIVERPVLDLALAETQPQFFLERPMEEDQNQEEEETPAVVAAPAPAPATTEEEDPPMAVGESAAEEANNEFKFAAGEVDDEAGFESGFLRALPETQVLDFMMMEEDEEEEEELVEEKPTSEEAVVEESQQRNQEIVTAAEIATDIFGAAAPALDEAMAMQEEQQHVEAPVAVEPQPADTPSEPEAVPAPAVEPAAVPQPAPTAAAAAAPAPAPLPAVVLPTATNPSPITGNDHISSILRDCSTLVTEVKSTLVDSPEQPLSTAARTAAWTTDLQALRDKCTAPRVFIGVVGDTGAGKSSMLNALLGEEDVLPVNGMRACTASVVEVSYGGDCYNAEIEFMTEAEWLTQVESFWTDLLNEDGVPQLRLDPDTRPDARSLHGAAQTQLESVLGRDLVRRENLTLDMLLKARNSITAHLGRTVKVREYNVKSFRKQIGRFVDSQNKRQDVSTWPLVKVCRISHNWPLLASGAVLVDLPGVRDANAARGRIAEGYLKCCNAIWVVADITRAVDNRTAKDLLGDTFRRQMVMDGQFGAISFVCTKADNLSSREIVETLGVEEISVRAEVPLDEFLALDDELTNLQDEEAARSDIHNRALKEERRAVRKVGRMDGLLQAADERLEALQGGDSSADEDEWGVRGGGGTAESSDEDSQMSEDEDEDEDLESEDDSEDDEDEEDLLRARDTAFKDGKKAGRKRFRHWDAAKVSAERVKLTQSVTDLRTVLPVLQSASRAARTELDRAQRACAKVQLKMNAICAAARNSYSKEQLRRDFREGIEAVEEAAADRGQHGETLAAAENTPEMDLPVFCISARDAQLLEGRCKKDGKPSAFAHLDHTEVPSLRDHVHDVAKKGRVHSARTAATAISHFMVSAAMSLVDIDGDAKHVESNDVQEVFDLHSRALGAALSAAVQEWAVSLERLLLQEGLTPRLNSGAARAEQAAMNTQKKWGAKPAEGGYYWATYKATVRPHRLGEYKSGSAGEINMNSALAGPLLDAISVMWDNTFSVRVSQHLRTLAAAMHSVMTAAMGELCTTLETRGLESQRLERLCAATLADEKRRVTDVLDALAGRVGEAQRDLSREVISPAVKSAMTPAYNTCSGEAGSGQFARMKAAMASHVDQNKGRMFTGAAAKMKDRLRELAVALKATADEMMFAVVERLPTHFSVLWEKPQSSPAQRAKSVVELAELSVRAEELCTRAGATPADRSALAVAACGAAAMLQQLLQQEQARALKTEQEGDAMEEDQEEEDCDEEEENEEEEEDSDEEPDEEERQRWRNRNRYYSESSDEMEEEQEEEDEEEEEQEEKDVEAEVKRIVEGAGESGEINIEDGGAPMEGVKDEWVPKYKIKPEPGLPVHGVHGEIISLLSDDEGH